MNRRQFVDSSTENCSVRENRTAEIKSSKSHTHCLAALAAHIQSQPISVLSAVQVDKAVNEKCPTARLTNEDWCNING